MIIQLVKLMRVATFKLLTIPLKHLVIYKNNMNLKSKVYFFGVFIILSLTFSVLHAQKFYNELYRPQYHFTAKDGWIGDPCGLTKYNGKYHFFWWGHAISDDLVHWKQLDWPMLGGTGFSYFTGSIIVDKDNTSGFNTRNKIPMIAIYTSAQSTGEQNQSISYCNSDDVTYNRFQYYSGNPVIDINSNSFRDPDVIWYEPTKSWIMSVVLADERKVNFYASKDLKTWNYLSSFGPVAARQEIWEVPSLIELPVNYHYKNKKWVLILGMGTNKVQYIVGNFDGTNFTTDPLFDSHINDGTGLEGDVFESFEKTDFNGWNVSGTAFGTAPINGTLPNQLRVSGYTGSKLLNSYVNGDASTGKLQSQSFKITKNNINFLIGGGNDVSKTCIRLLIDGNIVRSTAGDNSELLKWKGWNVTEFIGKDAQIEVVDMNTGSWGHILVDQIMFSDILYNTGLEHALWGDCGPDFYAVRPYRDYDNPDSQPLWQAWMSNWEYATVTPTSPWRGVQSMPREIDLKTSEKGYVIIQKPFKGFEKLRKDSVVVENLNITGNQSFNDFQPTRNTYEAKFTFDLTGNSDQNFGINFCIKRMSKVILGYNAATSNVYFDRTQSGNVSFSDRFPKVLYIPVKNKTNQLKFHVFVDESTIEIFINDGENVISSLMFPAAEATGIELFSKNGNTNLSRFEGWELKSIWNDNQTSVILPEESNFNVFVNRENNIIIEGINEKIDKLSIFNVEGKIVFNDTKNRQIENRIVIDEKFSLGMYILKIETNKGCQTKKIMILK